MKKRYKSLTLSSQNADCYSVFAEENQGEFEHRFHLYDLYLIDGYYVFLNPTIHRPVKVFKTSHAAGKYLDGLADKRIVE